MSERRERLDLTLSEPRQPAGWRLNLEIVSSAAVLTVTHGNEQASFVSVAGSQRYELLRALWEQSRREHPHG